MFLILTILLLHIVFSVSVLRNKIVNDIIILGGKYYPKILNLVKRYKGNENFKITESGGCLKIHLKEKRKEYTIYLPYNMFDKLNKYYGFKDGEEIEINNYPGVQPLYCPEEYEYIICKNIEGDEEILEFDY